MFFGVLTFRFFSVDALLCPFSILCDVMVMSPVRRRYRDISPVTLQVVGGTVSASLYSEEVEGVSGGLVESFLVEIYRCKLCQFTCGLKASISSHLLLRHRPAPTLPYLGGAADGDRGPEDRGGVASPYRLSLNGESKQSEEDEDFLLYNMLDNMSPPTCVISSEGGLQVAHTCEVMHTHSHTHPKGLSLPSMLPACELIADACWDTCHGVSSETGGAVCELFSSKPCVCRSALCLRRTLPSSP